MLVIDLLILIFYFLVLASYFCDSVCMLKYALGAELEIVNLHIVISIITTGIRKSLLFSRNTYKTFFLSYINMSFYRFIEESLLY
jgi:hypothetical protein